MRKNNRWKQVRSRVAYSDQYVRLRVDDVVKPDGMKGKFAVLEKQPGTTILPIDKKGNVYLIKEFRYPINQLIYQLPGGALAKGVSLKDNAKKELKEEAGMTSGNWMYLGAYAIGPGHEDTIDHIFLAFDVEIGKDEQEDVESIESLEKFTPRQAEKLLRTNKIKQSTSALALSLYLQFYAKS
jgi:ADP-ribose pyrophosphatase